MKIIAVVGTKKTGKTTLITKIIPELVERGFHVGTIKHIHNSFDVRGKDTWKHKEAGARLVVGAGDETFFMIKDSIELNKLLRMIECLLELDFVILEGFKHAEYAKISTSDYKDEFTITTVNVMKMDDETLRSIVDLIEERSFGMLPRLNCRKCGFEGCREFAKAMVRGEITEKACVTKRIDKVRLKIDGSMIFMNPFVQDFIKNTAVGMISSLKVHPQIEGKKIELLIKDDG